MAPYYPAQTGSSRESDAIRFGSRSSLLLNLHVAHGVHREYVLGRTGSSEDALHDLLGVSYRAGDGRSDIRHNDADACVQEEIRATSQMGPDDGVSLVRHGDYRHYRLRAALPLLPGRPYETGASRDIRITDHA